MSYTKKQTVIDGITAKIRSGEYPPRHRLPSGAELREIYACSAEPVRAALDYLKATGWVVGVSGSGVYVADVLPPA